MKFMGTANNRVSKWQIVKYAAMPAIIPRLRDLLTSGWQYISYFVALIYQAVRLLPPEHPYLDARNIGKYGLRHVIAAAASNLKWQRKHIDQIIVFGVVLVGIVLTFLQFIILGLSIFMPGVMAAAPAMPTSFAGFFVTPEPTQDLAHMMLDMVFGVQGIFNSCVSTAQTCYDVNGHPIVELLYSRTTGEVNAQGQWILESLGYPYPIHYGLHALFQLYSIGLLVVAAMITAYFIATVVAETAQTGTPFGKRFNKVWAPIRIVVAFGLLIPLGSTGLNSAQYIVLYAAKFGSAFATNGWNIFNSALPDGSYHLNQSELISQPNAPEINGLLQFLYVASVCHELEDIHHIDDPDVADDDSDKPYKPKIYLVKGPHETVNHLHVTEDTSYESMIQFLNGDKQAVFRFGLYNPKDYPSEMGYVKPVCGELVMPITDPRDPNATEEKDRPERGYEIMQRYYFLIVKELWHKIFTGDTLMIPSLADYEGENYPLNTAEKWTQARQDKGVLVEDAPVEYKSALLAFYREDLNAVMVDPDLTGVNSADYGDPKIGPDGALQEQRESLRWDMTQFLREKGWAAGGIWYNRIAEMNGGLTTAVLAIPMPTRYPQVMEYVAKEKMQQDENVTAANRFKPTLADDQDIAFPDLAADSQKARALFVGFDYWQYDGFATTTHTDNTGNFLIDGINYLLGTSGLFNMRKNANVHPLAQLVGIGRSLIESSIRNFGMATLGAALGFSLPMASGAATLGINILMTISTITMTVGFILFYIVPFLPFIYSFFALGGWVKGIFEAMVGVPLWALAHIRIDGEGLPGKAAMNGYFLIFEIFLRPILIVFGMLASIQIFSAMVKGLNETWDLVTANLTGFDASDPDAMLTLTEFFRSPIDEFFFTVIYALIVYLVGMSSFKLIDQIPNQILRWMGSGVKTFGAMQDDPAQGLIGSASLGINQFTGAATSSIKGGLGRIAGGLK